MLAKTLTGGITLTFALLSGCGGDSDSSVESVSATFVDSTVAGLQYRCTENGAIRTTEENGVLTCPANSTVTFLVGNIVLGDIVLTTDATIVTPAMLVGAGADQGTDEVVNIARFLLSLDTDQDPTNGITISSASLQDLDVSLSFDQTPDAFTTAASGIISTLTTPVPDGPFSLVDASNAADHLVTGLYLSFAGLYQGTVTYSAEGSDDLVFLVSREGKVYGSNQALSGTYATAGQDDEDNAMTTAGAISSFTIDGETGAAYNLVAQLDGGTASGATDIGVGFNATRVLDFDADIDEALIAELDDLLPLGIDLGNQDLFFIGTSNLDGFPYGATYGAPYSENPELETSSGNTLFGDIVSAGNGQVRMVAMSYNGYVLDVTFDLSGEQMTLVADWRHVYEETSGTTSLYYSNLN